MAITSIVRDLTQPYIVRISTSDNLAAVAGAGYVTAQTDNITALNHGLWNWLVGDFILIVASDGDGEFVFNGADFTTFILYSTAGNGAVTLPVVSGDFVVFDGTLGALKDAGYSASDPAKTVVVMAGSAVVVNHIAKFVDTAGTIDDTAGAAINSGNIQAGLSGTAGTLGSFPSAGSSGELIVAAVTNSSGNFNTTISNASAVGQSQVVSIPDGGSATSNFIISKSAGVQHITSGSLQVDAGDVLAGLAAGGTQGRFLAYPATGSKGALILAPVANTGNTNVTISNAAMGQASVVSIPDPGVAATSFLLLDSAGTQTIATGSLALTVGNITATAGNLQAGSSGHAGTVKSYPATGSRGSLALVGVASAADYAISLSNVSMGQATAISISDPGASTGYLNSSLVNASLTPVGAFITKDVVLGEAALAASGHVIIQAGSGAMQFKVRDIKMNYGAAGLTTGDRLIQITDGTTVYNNAGITAALLGTPINTVWGGSGNPLPGTVAMNTSTVAGSSLYAVYAGGTSDYTTGSVTVTVSLERVA